MIFKTCRRVKRKDGISKEGNSSGYPQQPNEQWPLHGGGLRTKAKTKKEISGFIESHWDAGMRPLGKYGVGKAMKAQATQCTCLVANANNQLATTAANRICMVRDIWGQTLRRSYVTRGCRPSEEREVRDMAVTSCEVRDTVVRPCEKRGTWYVVVSSCEETQPR